MATRMSPLLIRPGLRAGKGEERKRGERREDEEGEEKVAAVVVVVLVVVEVFIYAENKE